MITLIIIIVCACIGITIGCCQAYSILKKSADYGASDLIGTYIFNCFFYALAMQLMALLIIMTISGTNGDNCKNPKQKNTNTTYKKCYKQLFNS